MARGQSLGDLLIQSLGDAVAFESGALEARTHTVERTARDTKVDAPPRYDGPRIRTIRLRLAYSQHIFAKILNVSDQTIKAWEQGTRAPDGPTLRLLEIAEEAPEVFARKTHARGETSLAH